MITRPIVSVLIAVVRSLVALAPVALDSAGFRIKLVPSPVEIETLPSMDTSSAPREFLRRNCTTDDREARRMVESRTRHLWRLIYERIS